MGEASNKQERRKEHARKIVAAFERFINADIKAALMGDLLRDDPGLRNAREHLIEVLTTPPPKP